MKMNTFLPYPDFEQSVRCLDRQRLGKQRVEAWQIQRALLRNNDNWKRHPAARMWDGFLPALGSYGEACIREWERRGYGNNLKMLLADPEAPMPPWFGNQHFHASHRSNLLRKDPVHYGQFEWTEPPDLPYFWPV
jgi:hypothetical protein